MHERTQDAMIYVRTYGRPDLFVTFTCNPSWPEITDNIFPGQAAVDSVCWVSKEGVITRDTK